MRCFTRAASRQALRPTSQLLPRSFWTSSSRYAEVAEAPAEENDGLEDYLSRHYAEYDNVPQHGTKLYQYGVYSWYSLLGTALLSKELYILDSSTISHWIPDIIVFSTVAYLIGPALSNGLNSEVLLAKRLDIEAYESQQALLDVKLKDITALEAQPPALEGFVTEYKAALEAKAAAEIRIKQHAVHAETIAKLAALQSKKASADKASGDVAYEVVLAHLLKTLGSDAKISSQTVDEAIAVLEGKENKLGETFDGVLNAYLASPAFKTEKAAAEAALEAKRAKK